MDGGGREEGGEVGAGENRQSHDGRDLLERGIDDLGRGEPDALVDHLHAGVAGAHRDLLGAVGMAVEPGFADQKFDAAAELAGDALDLGTYAVETVARMRRRA